MCKCAQVGLVTMQSDKLRVLSCKDLLSHLCTTQLNMAQPRPSYVYAAYVCVRVCR